MEHFKLRLFFSPTSYSIKIDEDTTINNVIYQKLYYEKHFPGSWTFPKGYLRQDSTSKVFYKAGNADEILLYDFGLEVNDLFTDSECELIVTEIDTVTLNNGERRKRLKMEVYEGEGLGFDDDKWIEGIGSKFGLFYDNATCAIDFPNSLLCFYTNSELMYPSEPVTCVITTSTTGLKSSNIKVFPNPISSRFTIEDDHQALVGYAIVDLAGRQVLAGQLSAMQSEIKLENIIQGVYMLVLKDKNGNSYTQKLVKI